MMEVNLNFDNNKKKNYFIFSKTLFLQKQKKNNFKVPLRV